MTTKIWLRKWTKEAEGVLAKLEALVEEAGDETGSRGREFLAHQRAVECLRGDLIPWVVREARTGGRRSDPDDPAL